MNKQYFQLSYIFTFMFCLIGIAGNIELGIKTPIPAIIITSITGFLTLVKFAYLYILQHKGE